MLGSEGSVTSCLPGPPIESDGAAGVRHALCLLDKGKPGLARAILREVPRRIEADMIECAGLGHWEACCQWARRMAEQHQRHEQEIAEVARKARAEGHAQGLKEGRAEGQRRLTRELQKARRDAPPRHVELDRQEA
jgi:flagellar biosynthesis/type III secretory pathway protein FliH